MNKALIFLFAFLYALRNGDSCVYKLQFTEKHCKPRSIISLMVELGNEQQQFASWGQKDLDRGRRIHSSRRDRNCVREMELGKAGEDCLRDICHLRLIRFATLEFQQRPWWITSVRVSSSNSPEVHHWFNTSKIIGSDGQATLGSCCYLNTTDDEMADIYDDTTTTDDEMADSYDDTTTTDDEMAGDCCC